MLRDTVGEKGYKQTDEMSFSTPPSLRATSPIFCVTKHRGGVLNVSDSETEIPHKATGTRLNVQYKPADEGLFSTPPSLRATSSVWLMPPP